MATSSRRERSTGRCNNTPHRLTPVLPRHTTSSAAPVIDAVVTVVIVVFVFQRISHAAAWTEHLLQYWLKSAVFTD